VGPVPTRALVRGVLRGKVPPDTEAREVAGGTWMPLAAYDEFYEALGLDDAETRVVETPWFLSQEASAAAAPLADADEAEDEEATRVMEALCDSMPPESSEVDSHGAAPERETDDAKRFPHATASEPTAGSLLDADEGEDSNSGGYPIRAPLPAAGRPAISSPPAAPQGDSSPSPQRVSEAPGSGFSAAQGVDAANQPDAGVSVPPRSSYRPRRRSSAHYAPERSDERTTPGLRHVRQVNARRAIMLVVLSVALLLAMVANVILLLMR
jgi:hypothetical protein